MTRIAITGHRGLPSETTELVDKAIRAELAKRSDEELVGLSCIADGADTLFARAVLDAGGSLIVVVPAQQYRDGLPTEHHVVYDDLIARALDVIALSYRESTSEAHQAASERMLDNADELFAVWDGKPARGYGGTADVVAVAQQRGMPITVVWPDGARRD
ncbi:hypothetical protein [Nocardia mexicana]|uniref:DNA recombination-mediator protein A n=1 Tax=Nocardia mexicana TaxID=279262 RepID=A0A370GXZ2_9NOCA|nr:hypothetical protein [Nocardia mexicana]RDI48545.1 hypothetical protein DFR68_108381 [Nocardia mexicana]